MVISSSASVCWSFYGPTAWLLTSPQLSLPLYTNNAYRLPSARYASFKSSSLRHRDPMRWLRLGYVVGSRTVSPVPLYDA